MGDRWATFDCYGTLIDWNGGLRTVFGELFGEERGDAQLERYHDVEPALQVDGERSYREVMREAMRELGARPEDEDALAEALPSWEPFPEVRVALEETRSRGWKLAALSNTDRDFIDASLARIGVPFELTIVASEIGSYKPAHRHWLRFFEVTAAERETHVHVAQSHFHDIVPSRELRLRSIWVNRNAERFELAPTRELRDLSPLADTLDELIAS